MCFFCKKIRNLSAGRYPPIEISGALSAVQIIIRRTEINHRHLKTSHGDESPLYDKITYQLFQNIRDELFKKN